MISSAFLHDANHQPITFGGITSIDIQTLVGNNTTTAVPIFGLTGQVQVTALWGVVTTVFGANNTAAYWRLNDATNQSDITLATGTTLTTAPVGSLLVKKGLVGAALTLLTSAQERVSEPTTLETSYFSPFVLVQKNGVVTNVEFVYTTTDTPTSGAITFYISWVPLTPTSFLTPL